MTVAHDYSKAYDDTVKQKQLARDERDKYHKLYKSCVVLFVLQAIGLIGLIYAYLYCIDVLRGAV